MKKKDISAKLKSGDFSELKSNGLSKLLEYGQTVLHKVYLLGAPSS